MTEHPEPTSHTEDWRWTYADLRIVLLSLLAVLIIIAVSTQWPFSIGLVIGLTAAMIAVEHHTFRFPFVGGLLVGSIVAGGFYYSMAVELARESPSAIGSAFLQFIHPTSTSENVHEK